MKGILKSIDRAVIASILKNKKLYERNSVESLSVCYKQAKSFVDTWHEEMVLGHSVTDKILEDLELCNEYIYYIDSLSKKGLKVLIVNCDGIEVSYFFYDKKDFYNKMNSDEEIIPMLDDTLLEADGKTMPENTTVDDFYKYVAVGVGLDLI